MNEEQEFDTDHFVRFDGLKMYYDTSSGGLLKRKHNVVKALDDINITLKKDEILGLAGESGSGKTTAGEILVRLQDQTDGTITIGNRSYSSDTKMKRAEEKAFRKDVPMIFQDPYETLNPRFTIFKTIAEPLIIRGLKDKEQIEKLVIKSLETAELRPASQYMHRYPHELSGGQRQRVAIARGIVINPKVLVVVVDCSAWNRDNIIARICLFCSKVVRRSCKS